jgi:hypothetical protein
VTFGLNRSYLAFDRWGFASTYHVVVNTLVAQQSGAELALVPGPLFTSESNRGLYPGASAEPYYLKNDRPAGFYGNVANGIWEGATVTYVAMQLAYYMGFQRVILVGVDHRFATTGEPHTVVETLDTDENHFDPSYFGRGYKWQLPDLATSQIAYELARSAFERRGRSIVDATVGGGLTVFPKVDLAKALA